jgi:endonuclease-8
LMLFGSYRINERRKGKPRLSLHFKNGELNFYTCSVQLIEEPLNKVYDWSADVMNKTWDARKAKIKLKESPDIMVCDALLDQHIFAGVGNIIKNEVLFRIKVHPESKIGSLPAKQLNDMINEARNYSFEFLKWKKDFVLRKHWLAYGKKICPRDHIPFEKKHLGKTKRRSFFCEKCQVLYE